MPGSKNDPPKVKSAYMNEIFDGCVDFLEWLAPLLGTSYKEINVWLFVILMPGIILIQGVLCLYLWRKLRRLEARLIKARRGWV